MATPIDFIEHEGIEAEMKATLCTSDYERHLLVGLITLPVLWSFQGLAWLHNVRFPWWPIWANPLVWLFLVVDIAYNATAGSVIFRELPRELLFTTRVQRHVDAGSEQAIFIARILNEADPGHVRLPA